MNIVSKGSHKRLSPVTVPCEDVVTNCCVNSTNDIQRACLGLRLFFLHYDVGMVIIKVVFDYLRPRPRQKPRLVLLKSLYLVDLGNISLDKPACYRVVTIYYVESTLNLRHIYK